MKGRVVHLFLAAALLFLGHAATAQHQPLDPQKFNAKLLEKLILQRIDSLRKAHKKPAFAQDAILQKAAADHATFLAKKGELTHFQEKGKRYNPQDRVLFYGGKGYYAGENAAEHPVQVLLHKLPGQRFDRVKTYQQSAELFVLQWATSKPHMENLMRTEYALTGLAVSLDKKSGRIYAVQVFSPRPEAQ
ncbi:CAP domain-containing protein [Cesiribacter andamanensis]|uniref:Cysteine-rich secretory protein family protein n=1 Tax=Cesiribacter andamanensis AMV16 TaxID=1279009 RepID=M7N8A8_9BACT|nr:CAP domain-containing protein [Cesiribacter andamanensis]EMR03497.1 Cysteine-rich secretory protein family protein [Cesiribacter andamanensis AMV16]